MNQRIGVIVLLSIATLGLLVSLTTRGWFRDSAEAVGVSTNYGIGLWGNSYQESCGDAVEKQSGSKCQSATGTLEWSNLRGAKKKAWLLFGRLTLLLGVLAALALIGLIALTYKRDERVTKLWLLPVIGVGATMFCAGLYLALQPDKAGSLGYSVFVFFPSAVGALLGSLMVTGALAAPEERPLPGIGVS